MNKKLVVAALLPGLCACAGHSTKNSRNPASVHSSMITKTGAASVIDKAQKTKAVFQPYSADPQSDDQANLSVDTGTHVLKVFVSDPSEYPIAGATVQVKESQEGSKVVNANGISTFNLSPGDYHVHAEGGNLKQPLDETVTLTGVGATSILTMMADEKGNGTPGPQDGSGTTVVVSAFDSDKVIKKVTLTTSDLAKYQKPYSKGVWNNLGEMCKWQRLPWDGSNSRELTFGAFLLSPTFVMELSVGCNVYNGQLTPKVRAVNTFINGNNTYQTANGSVYPDDTRMDSPDLKTNIPGKHDKHSVYSFSLTPEGKAQNVVLKGETSSFYFSPATVDPQDPRTSGYNAWAEDLVGHTTVGGTDYSFVNYQIQTYWLFVTMDDSSSGNPAKDGSAVVQKLVFLTSGKSGYPIVGQDHFSSLADPDTFELATRATQLAAQDPSLSQNPVAAYAKAYATAEAAQAGPTDALTSWNYYRAGAKTQAMFTKLYGQDQMDNLNPDPLSDGAAWMDQMGLSFAYPSSPTNNVYSWKNTFDRNKTDSFVVQTFAPRWGQKSRQSAQAYGAIQPYFPGILKELQDNAASLGSGSITADEVQSLIAQAKKSAANP